MVEKKTKNLTDVPTNLLQMLPASIQSELQIPKNRIFDRLWEAVTLLILIGDQKFLVSDKALDPIR